MSKFTSIESEFQKLSEKQTAMITMLKKAMSTIAYYADERNLKYIEQIDRGLLARNTLNHINDALCMVTENPISNGKTRKDEQNQEVR